MNSHPITGLILAGGRGSRMGGIDKGLQNFNGSPLVQHALTRLQTQQGDLIADTMIVANRNQSTYQSLGVQVLSDSMADFAGPLAGFLTGLEHCQTSHLLTVPCDSPLFPLNLAQQLLEAMAKANADIALAAAREDDSVIRAQPVFCLMKVTLRESLSEFMHTGGRKVDAWTAQHTTIVVPFDTPDMDPRAFFNANTLEELHRLEKTS
jgi:molybdopterin-guanine dinucleotide biosynthesis protein A